VEASSLSLLTDGMISKLLQVRRMCQRGDSALVEFVLGEVVHLARELEPMVAAEQMEAARQALAGQRWRKPTLDVSVSEGYQKWAETYDGETNALIAAEEPVVWELLGDVGGKEVLDACCGTGRYAIRLAEAGARVCGFDAAPAMLLQAERKLDERGLCIDLRQGEVTEIPFPDKSFDAAVCALALCHIAALGSAIGELARVLRPGGTLVLSDFHPFPILFGWRTWFSQGGTSYLVQNQLHLVADYLEAAATAGLALRSLREEVIDERLEGILSSLDIERFRGMPLALVISATKETR